MSASSNIFIDILKFPAKNTLPFSRGMKVRNTKLQKIPKQIVIF
jgi:hypothetical protein